MIVFIITAPIVCYMLMMFTVAIVFSSGYKLGEMQSFSIFVAYIQIYFVVIVLVTIKRRINDRRK